MSGPRLLHIGLPTRSEANADRFFGELLGFEKTRRSALPADLAHDLYRFSQDCEILYYESKDILFEIFVTGWGEEPERKLSHVCIEVPDRDALLARAARLGFEVRDGPRFEWRVYYVVDDDGNLFEIKEPLAAGK